MEWWIASGTIMRRIPASVFKAHCLAVIQNVQTTGEPVVVTNKGFPMVRIVPVTSTAGEVFGFMKGEFKIVGDIESPMASVKQRQVTRRPKLGFSR